MIDIHNHILPRVDDGSRSMEESIELIKNLKEKGVTGIVLTPHYMIGGMDTSVDVIEDQFDKLKKDLKWPWYRDTLVSWSRVVFRFKIA